MFRALLVVVVVLAIGILQSEQSEVTLIWSDEFYSARGSEIDLKFWNHVIGDGSDRNIPGWGNSELQYYTDGVENVATDGKGHLVITARKSNSSGYQCYYGLCSYTSGRVTTKLSWQYGRIEARIKTPNGQGLWPAFWMLGENIGVVGWPESGEIDIMELKGSQPMTVSGAVHGPEYSGGESIHGSMTLASGPSFAEDFHVFSVDWHPTSITWSVDGRPYHKVTPGTLGGRRWVFDQPFRILLNVAVGGHFDGNPGSNVDFPQSLLIDYVRVYSYNASLATLNDVPVAQPLRAMNSSVALFNKLQLNFLLILVGFVIIFK